MAQLHDGYALQSFGGVGNHEKGYNLSASAHKLSIKTGAVVYNLMVDLGAYQGLGKLDRDIDAIIQSGDIKTVIATHGHLDHIGEMMHLIKHNVSVLATPGTATVMQVALTDIINIAWRNYEDRKIAFETYIKQKIKPAIQFVKNYESKEKGTKKIKRDGRGNRMSTTNQEHGRKDDYERHRAVLEENNINPRDPDWYHKLPHPSEPEFCPEDVHKLMKNVITHDIQDGWHTLAPGIAVSFFNAGHILGSASPLIRITDAQKKNHYILFSGDIGSYDGNLHLNGLPIPPNNIPLETLVIESTYGGRDRPKFDKSLREYEHTLSRDVRKYNTIIQSCFSLDRLQRILYHTIDAKKKGLIPQDIPIFVDSNMGAKYIEPYLQEARKRDKTRIDPKQKKIREFVGEGYTDRANQSLDQFIQYLDPRNGEYIIIDATNRDLLVSKIKQKIIITASGMADGGPIVEYLKTHGNDPKTAIYFPGFLAPGTNGYKIAADRPEGKERKLILDGREYEIRARTRQFHLFSGHGDEKDLLRYIDSTKRRKDTNIVIVHGDVSGSSRSFQYTLERKGKGKHNIRVPDIGDILEVTFTYTE